MIQKKISSSLSRQSSETTTTHKIGLASHGFPARSQKTARRQALIGRFEMASIAWIPLVAEFGTDHIEKAVFVTSASIFSETVGGMELKFGEDQSLHRRILYY